MAIGPPEVELDRAETWFRKALAQDRGFTEARIRLAYILSRLGRHADANGGVQRAARVKTPTPAAVLRRAAARPAQIARRRRGPRDRGVRAEPWRSTPNAQSPRLGAEPAARDAGDRDGSVRELAALITPATESQSRRPLVGVQLDARAERGRAARASPAAMNPMSRLLIAVCVVLALPDRPPTRQAVFSARVTNVRVDALVTDGRPGPARAAARRLRRARQRRRRSRSI